MTSGTYWQGLPYTPLQGWRVTSFIRAGNNGRASPSSSTCTTSSPTTLEAFTSPHVQLQSIHFIADVYNTHHRCCWPRTLLDTCLADVRHAEAGGATASTRAHSRHAVATYMRALHAAQQASLPRALLARRVIYQEQLPPVLRCAADGEVVYVLTGVLCLTLTPPQDSPAEEQAWSAEQARTHFPTFLAMQPSAECATYLQPDPPTLSRSGAVVAKPQLMLLQDVTVCAAQPGDATPTRWRARYSSFTWLLTPMGNAHLSYRANVSRSAGQRKRDTRCAPCGDATLPHAESESPAELSDLPLAFSIWATPHSMQAVLDDRLRRLSHYSPVVSREERYGIAGHSLPAAEVLGTFGRRRQRILRHRPAVLRSYLQRRAGGGERPESSCVEQTRSSSSDDTQEETHLTDTSAGQAEAVMADGDSQTSAVKLVHIADLRTTAPLRRECCMTPNSTLIGTVMPSWTSWPLRVPVYSVEEEEANKSIDVSCQNARNECTLVDATATLSELADIVDVR